MCCLLVACQTTDKKENVEKKSSSKNQKKDLQSLIFDEQNARKALEEFGEQNPETQVRITTKFGVIRIQLYEDTPLHRANFIYLAKKKYFDHTVFHRVIKDFMIQGGASDSKNPVSIGNYYVPAEILPHYFHKKGALAMARDEDHKNPTKRSSPHDFFIIQGTPLSEGELGEIEEEYRIKIPTDRRKVYKSIGGTPHLDQDYTIFGQVVEGLDVIQKIASVETDKGNWPIQEITMKVEVLE